MERYRVTVEIAAIGVADSDVEGILDTLAEYVHELHGVDDPDLGANLGKRRFDISMYVDAPDQIQAAIAALEAARAAIHASGGGTAGWDERFRELGHEVRALEPLPA